MPTAEKQSQQPPYLGQYASPADVLIRASKGESDHELFLSYLNTLASLRWFSPITVDSLFVFILPVCSCLHSIFEYNKETFIDATVKEDREA